MVQRDPVIQRFLTVVQVTVPVVAAFAALLYILAAAFQSLRMGIGATGILVCTIALLCAYRALLHNNASNAARWVAGGVLSGTLMLTGAVPDLHTSTVLVPLLVAILLLQYTPPQLSRYALIGCGLTSGVVVVLGQSNMSPLLRSDVAQLLNASLTITNSAVAMMLLWQLTSHLHEVIAATHAANTALIGLNNRLQRELHEHQRTMSALHASEQQGQALLHAIPDALFRLNRNGSVLDLKYFDPAQATNAPNAQAEHEIAALLPAADMIEHTLETRLIHQYVRQIGSGTKACTYEGRVVAVNDHDVVAIVRDVTEAHAVEQLKSEFVSTISHELRTPLTAIRGAINLIVGGVVGEVPSQVQSMLEIAARNCERLLRLVNDILDIDQLETGTLPMQKAVVPLAPLIKQAVVANAMYGVPFKVQLHLVEPIPTISVRVDSARLTQAITNLISNAVKFSPADSTVQVCVQVNEAIVRISVTDQGPGVDEAFQNRIFQRFAQADSSNTRVAQGSGLGLSITKAIVEQCDGRVSFHNEPTGGTTFFIDLPIVQEME